MYTVKYITQYFENILSCFSDEGEIVIIAPACHHDKLKTMISETHECINNDLHNILKNKHEISNITTPFEYQPIPIYDALLYLREYYTTIIHNLLVEIIKSRILMEYVNNTNISNDKSNQYIPWDIDLMCNIPNPMP